MIQLQLSHPCPNMRCLTTENRYGRPAAYLSPDGRIQIETGFGQEERLIRVVEVGNGARKVLHELRG
jgi:hypothetical protein